MLFSREFLKLPAFIHEVVEGGIPLPPRIVARGFEPPLADKPSNLQKWH
jgi:hypothetical protein